MIVIFNTVLLEFIIEFIVHMLWLNQSVKHCQYQRHISDCSIETGNFKTFVLSLKGKTMQLIQTTTASGLTNNSNTTQRYALQNSWAPGTCSVLWGHCKCSVESVLNMSFEKKKNKKYIFMLCVCSKWCLQVQDRLSYEEKILQCDKSKPYYVDTDVIASNFVLSYLRKSSSTFIMHAMMVCQFDRITTSVPQNAVDPMLSLIHSIFCHYHLHQNERIRIRID